MKKHTLLPEILIFSIIFLGCILPPFFTTAENIEQETFTNWTFPWQALGHGLFATILYILSLKLLPKKDFDDRFSRGQFFLFFLLIPFTLSFGTLFSVSLVMKFFALIFKADSVLTVQKPDSLISILFCVLLFANSAFYEEVIYRFYFPEALLRFVKIKPHKKWLEITLNILIEVTGACVFAFAHLYSGYFSVINAFLAHIILRICFKKSGNIWGGFAAHFVYNMISLILL
ncbi:MAG: CPBP family intramembrane metalloprotease [Treponema sp.]|nr:CPBP family intramembrane metalloprotease [Treponema sp.]